MIESMTSCPSAAPVVRDHDGRTRVFASWLIL
jgi:hypothetical protein